MMKHIYFYFISIFLLTNHFVVAKTILVTGGAGFIGSHVTQALLSRDDTVILVDNFDTYYNPLLKRANIKRLQSGSKSHLLHVYEFDICDFDKFEESIKNNCIDVICHIAACAGVRNSVDNPNQYIRTNIVGTLHILELAKKYKISHVVIASSSSVYGNSHNVPFQEEERVNKPCSPYAMTKLADELLAYTYHYLYNISCTCLRFFTVYGPCGRPDMAPFKFMDLIYRDKKIQQYGDGSSIRDFTYITDIVDGVMRALDKHIGYEVINLGKGEPVSLNSFIHTLERVMGKKANIEIIQKPASDVDMTHADISKARRLLGYNPKVSLKEGLGKMYKWYLEEYLSAIKE